MLAPAFRSLTLAALTVLAALEGGAWVAGERPWSPAVASFSVSPADWVAGDARQGWVLRPGTFEFAYPGGHQAVATHTEFGRVTPSGKGRVIELHGGSFAYGLGLDDEQSLGWRLQERLPDFDVQSRAVPGHGPLQAWTALEQHLEQGTAPYAMVVTYVEFHDERVTWNRSWRRAMSGNSFAGSAGASMPAVRNRSGWPRVEPVEPRLRPLRGSPWSARIAARDRLLDDEEEHRLQSAAVTRNLLVHLHHRAKENGTYVLVVGLSDDASTRSTLDHLADQGVLTLDAGLQWRDPRNQLWPHDTHPNAAAAEAWARTISDVVLQRPAADAPAGTTRRPGEAE